LWIKPSSGIKEKFVQLSKEKFHAVVSEINDNSCKEINEWVSKQTENKIPSIIDKINSDDILILVNAIYFKALFVSPFPENQTRDETFKQENGSLQKCRLMTQKKSFPYAENDLFQAISLPYNIKEGTGRLSASVFLPKEGHKVGALFDFVSKNWDQISTSFKTEEVRLSLPKFKVEYSTDLIDPLKNLGVKRGFSSDAQFDEMFNNPKGIKISQVLHKTFVEVDEKGTEAAAVTAIRMNRCMAIIKKQIEMTVDHPFLFLIQSDHVILFGGIIHSV